MTAGGNEYELAALVRLREEPRPGLPDRRRPARRHRRSRRDRQGDARGRTQDHLRLLQRRRGRAAAGGRVVRHGDCRPRALRQPRHRTRPIWRGSWPRAACERPTARRTARGASRAGLPRRARRSVRARRGRAPGTAARRGRGGQHPHRTARRRAAGPGGRDRSEVARARTGDERAGRRGAVRLPRRAVLDRRLPSCRVSPSLPGRPSPAAPARTRLDHDATGVRRRRQASWWVSPAWRTSRSGGARRPAWRAGTSIASSLAAITVAVTISLLLGHAVAVTILACLVRLGLAPDVRDVPMSSLRSTVPLGLVALGGAFGLLLAAGPGTVEQPEAPRLTVVPSGLRSVVLAVDGVDPERSTGCRVRAGVPTFSRLLGQGVATIAADADRDPARVWTTIATGQPPDRHGIRALESREVAGLAGRLRADSSGWALLAGATDVLRLTRPAIASGDERLIPTFWEVAARAGFRSAAVHWWATWPAPPDAGIVAVRPRDPPSRASGRARRGDRTGHPVRSDFTPAGPTTSQGHRTRGTPEPRAESRLKPRRRSAARPSSTRPLRASRSRRRTARWTC